MDRDQLVQQMGETFGQLKRAMHVYLASNVANSQVSPAQLGVLKAIACHQPISSKALARHMQMTPGAISQLLEGLDHAGCIIRSNDETDRRVSYLSLSDEGQTALKNYDALYQRMIQEAMHQIPDSDLNSYVHVQRVLTNWLESQVNTQKES